ncbi:MAG: hypothetical protein GC134_09720 [Proteobacteria bacterium]|nr:hypothetical protein [Pseudomonadota bacterium]
MTTLNTLRQVLAFVSKPQILTNEQEERLRIACIDALDADDTTVLDRLALETAKELLDWALTAKGGEAKKISVLDAQTNALMDADELTADLTKGFARQYRLVEQQTEIATAARDRLKMVVEALYRAINGGRKDQMAAAERLAVVYLQYYREWLVAYKQERAALDAFAAGLEDAD